MRAQVGHVAAHRARAVENRRTEPDAVVHGAEQRRIAFAPAAVEIGEIHENSGRLLITVANCSTAMARLAQNEWRKPRLMPLLPLPLSVALPTV
ncbi:hypothetical protein D3C86_1992740 [compost metagenome]